MSDPYIGEIRMFGGNFAPAGWAFCWGQLQAISQNDALFNLIGTTYGGDGQETFGLPNLAGRVPIHVSASYQLGEAAGVESVTVSINQMPSHTHALIASGDQADQISGGNGVLANPVSLATYIAADPDAALNAGTIAITGGSQPHENMQPYLAVSYIISLFGIFPHQ
jgi:microcystin-dependent protein